MAETIQILDNIDDLLDTDQSWGRQLSNDGYPCNPNGGCNAGLVCCSGERYPPNGVCHRHCGDMLAYQCSESSHCREGYICCNGYCAKGEENCLHQDQRNPGYKQSYDAVHQWHHGTIYSKFGYSRHSHLKTEE